MNWNEATYEQLHEIIFNDVECELKFKWQAFHELKKRNDEFNVFFSKLDNLINKSLNAQKKPINDFIQRRI
jgi:hypothetical protein